MIEIRNLSLCRGDRVLFSKLNMDIQAGQLVVILGPNGAGKSTLLQALLGLFAPEDGDIAMDGLNISQYSRQSMAQLVAWQGDLPPSEFGLTVSQRLHLANQEENRINRAVEAMDLHHLQQRSLAELSSGERQRVEIAAIMVRDNPIWLMDEPTAHLDLKHQADCLKLMKSEATQGRIIITVLHDLQQAASIADVVILLDGKGDIQVDSAEAMLIAERLEQVFCVKLKGAGRDLMPVY